MSGRVVQDRYDLSLNGENTYASATAQDPLTSRRLQSWLPTDDAMLHREMPHPLFSTTTLPGPVVSMYNFNQNDPTGNVQRFYFAATRTDFIAGTKTCNLYKLTGASWNIVSSVGVLADAPMFRTLGNNLHIVDGVLNWLFDGTTWVQDGMEVLDSVRRGSNQTTNIVASPSGLAMTYAPFTITSLVDSTTLARPGTGVSNVTAITNFVDPPHPNIQPGDSVVISGAAVVAYNGTWVIQSTSSTGGFFSFVFRVVGSSLAPSSGTGTFLLATVTTTSPHGYIPGQTVLIAGAGVSGYNGTWVVSSSLTPTSFVVRIATSGLAASGNGTVTPVTTTLSEFGPAIDASSTGSFTCLVGRNYWYTNADETPGRVHESSSSGNNAVPSGALTSKKVSVYQTPGLFTSTNGSAAISITSAFDTPGPQTPYLSNAVAGQVIYINGTLIGTIASATDTQITLTAPATVSFLEGRAVICDPRATHWHIYASESDGSLVGQYLASVPVTQDLTTFPFYDQSPFISSSANLFLPIFRPVRNDPPPGSTILEVHKYRLWRNRTTKPNFFNFTAYEEVLSGSNGDATESVPGADVNTISDIVNEVSFPDQSNRIRGILSHGDANYLFSERQCFPLYGESIDDFSLSQVTAFSVGLAGRFAGKSTPHGLVFMSYDTKVLLYPSSRGAMAAVPTTANATSILQEIGKPKRNTFNLIDRSRLDEVVCEFYFYGPRNWFVYGIPMQDGTFQTWVYDFGSQGWFQLQRGYSSLSVIEYGNGVLMLVGGAADGKTYVIDDQSGTFAATGNLPQATYRPALIDFGDPSIMHSPLYVEYEVTDPAMNDDITVNFYLDPPNADAPGAPTGQVTMRPIRGANRFSGFFTGGTVCHRMLFEIVARPSAVPGAIRGMKLIANKIPGFLSPIKTE